MSAGYMRKCAGKQRHTTKEDAQRHRSALARSSGCRVDLLRVYRCDQHTEGATWHVGHARGWAGKKAGR